jgi:capsular exopolysaccharide synthesis family protein
METTNMQEQSGEEGSLADIFFHYLNYWKWFVASLFVCLLISFIYLRYTTREYSVSSRALIKDEQKGRTAMDMNTFSDLGFMPKIGSFDNEIEVLQSKTLMKEVVDSLNLRVAYYTNGKLKKNELYNQTPLWVILKNQIGWGSFILDKKGDTFSIEAQGADFQKTFKIDEEINSPWGTLTFEKNPFGTGEYPIVVVVRHPKYIPSIQVNPLNKMTTVVDVTTQTEVPQKGIDVINTLIGIYNQRSIAEKNYVANHTIDFINDRITTITEELSSSEQKVEEYKQGQGMTDLTAEAQLFLTSQSEYSKKIIELQNQMSVISSVKNYLSNPDNKNNGAPANVGITDPMVISLMNAYNTEIFEKNRATLGLKPTNSIVREYEERIALLRTNLLKGIDIAENGMETTLNSLKQQSNSYLDKIRNLSVQERESRKLYRDKDIKESLFIYLLQKKEETGLSLVLATPNAIIIDKADYQLTPIQPKGRMIILVALLLGLIIPIAVIYIMDLFDNKLRNKDQLLKEVKAPFLGDIPQLKSAKVFPVLNVRSAIAEKFRIIVSNLEFVVSGEKTKVIMITSSFSGEGKSFFSQNLAMSFATLGHKSLLIDLDMRKSVVDKTLMVKSSKGIAMYLSDPAVTISDIIDNSGSFHKNLDIISIKVFPPNPSELFASDRLDQLFESVKNQYDYVIVDTAPIGLVADAFRVNQFVDATIYVARADYTYKTALSEMHVLYEQNKLHNLTMVLNGVQSGARYGYNYGEHYGYYTQED